MSMSDERIFRSVYAAIVGSRLSSREIRQLVRNFSDRSEFVHDLQKALWEFADSLESSFVKQPRQEDFDAIGVAVSSPLIDILIDRVHSERMSKQRLSLLLQNASKRGSSSLDPTKQTLRQMVELFIEQASLDEVRKAMASLGIVSSRDPYLGGIHEKTKGEL